MSTEGLFKGIFTKGDREQRFEFRISTQDTVHFDKNVEQFARNAAQQLTRYLKRKEMEGSELASITCEVRPGYAAAFAELWAAQTHEAL